ncbi:molybdopterin-dependent oxidoreductase [Ellagibacter isourolithinifaciens]|uniref:molybdopterin-dependent oxidoreductase n=1 Tax=Ellagibacter isourolithinifaciens TaxID=2137581 RepID=UPI003A923593
MAEVFEWKTERDDETIIRTHAWSPPGCHPVGCGLQLHVKDGKIVKVEGEPSHPITRGALCPRCLALKEFIYHPDRVIYPQKRAREDRGLDKWERITWDEAYDIIETNAKRIIAEYGEEAIMVFGGTGRQANTYYPLMAFMVFGSPNACYAQSGWSCYGPRATITAHLMGGGYPEIDNACRYADRYDHPGWEAPKYILMWGKEPLKSNPDGFWGHSVIDLMRRGTKLICVDPRIHWLASRAEQVVQLRPGTDTALALAMLNHIVENDLYDHDFVDRWCYGFDEFAERVRQYPPSWAASICGVSEEQIIDVATKFATEKHSALGWGLAVDQNPNGVQLAQSLLSLLAITGNLDEPGGCTLGTPIAGDDDPARDMANWGFEAGVLKPEVWEKRLGAKEYPGFSTIMNQCHPDFTLNAMQTGEYKCRMAYFHSSNVVSGAIAAQPDKWYEALKDVDFAVAQETFMNPTAMALADVFLPLTTFAEHNGHVQPHYGLNAAFEAAINKAITVGECKCDIEIMIDLGKRMHPDFWNQFESVEDYLEKRVIPKGMTFDDFRNAGVIQPEEVYRKYEKGMLRPDGQVGFLTRTGRFELYSTAFPLFGEDPLPYYMEPPFSPYNEELDPTIKEEYPLILTTGARTYVSFHSEHRQIESLRDMVPDPLLDIHPTDAAKLGIKDGDWVMIENQFGKCRQRANVTPTILPGVVHAMHAWWYPEKDPNAPSLFGAYESNVNTLLPNGYIGKIGFGDTFKANLCKVTKDERMEV